MWELIQQLSPAQRMAVIGVIVGAIVNGVKRWPKVPAQWVPLAALAFASALSALYFYAMNLTAVGMFDFVVQSVLTATLPIAGHKFLKAPWVAVFGEDSADKWLGQADNNESISKTLGAGLLVFFVALVPIGVIGCGGSSWAKVSNDALEKMAESNNSLVDELDKIQDAARESRIAIMNEIAEHAPSKEAGMKALDKTDAAYDVVWKALEKAEALQHTLAQLIETARAAIDTGTVPSIDGVMKTFSELQATQAAISKALAEVKQ